MSGLLASVALLMLCGLAARGVWARSPLAMLLAMGMDSWAERCRDARRTPGEDEPRRAHG